MFFKKKQVELVRYYSFLWNESEPVVKFDHVYHLFRECNLTVVDMTYRSSHPLVDNQCMITFGLKGTIQNLELFDVKALRNSKLKMFYANTAI